MIVMILKHYFFYSSSSSHSTTNNEETTEESDRTCKLITELNPADRTWTTKLTVVEKQSPKKSIAAGRKHQNMTLVDSKVTI